MYRQLPDIFLGLLIVALPFAGNTAPPWLIGIVTAIAITALAGVRHAPTITITLTDLLAAALLIGGILNIAFVRHWEVDPAIIARWAVLTLLYLAVRCTGKRSPVIPMAIAVSALLQTVVMLAQSVDWAGSNHLYHPITGSFANPGPLGGFLVLGAIGCAALIVHWHLKSHKTGTIGGVVIFVILSVGVIVSGSRAAIVAVLAGATYALLSSRSKRLRRLFPLVAVGTIAAGAVALYSFGKDSADGRLLIWRVSANLIADAPVLGFGVGSFPEQYMFYQADYFADHPGSPAAQIADNVTYPFNEGMKTLTEQGLLGGILILALLISALGGTSKNEQKSESEKTYRAMLWGWLAFACFSYPSDVLPLAALLAVLIAGSGGRPVWTFRPRPSHIGVGMALTVGVAWTGIWCLDTPHLRAYSQRNLRYQTKQLMVRATLDDLPALERMASRIPAVEVYTDLGDTYLHYGRTDDARRCFTLAMHMVPSRILPHYGLFRTLQAEGKADSALIIAQRAVALPAKTGNTATLRIRSELQEYIRNQTSWIGQ